MIELIFVVLILLVIAWAFTQFLPHPIGTIGAVIVALLALYLLVSGVIGDGDISFRD